jgi:hypothetical protein
MNAAESTTDASTIASPASEDPAPPAPATSPTPASASTLPAQPSGPAVPRRSATAVSATSTGTAPTISDAWLTFVRAMPAFWSTMTTPNPIAPARATRGVSAARSCAGRVASRSSGAARPKRNTVSQPASSHSSASFDSGTVRPQSTPAATSATNAPRRPRIVFSARKFIPMIVGDRAQFSTWI